MEVAGWSGATIDEVRIRDLEPHPDARGSLTELFRDSWLSLPSPAQWNLTVNRPGALRGMHLHRRRIDSYVQIEGEAELALMDLRWESRTYRHRELLRLSGEHPRLVVVPPGVLHGFYFRAEGLLLIGIHPARDDADEMRCHWSDPQLGLAWRPEAPLLSQADAEAGDLASLERTFRDGR